MWKYVSITWFKLYWVSNETAFMWATWGGCDYMKESFFWVFIISVEQDSAVLGEAQTCLKWWLCLFSLMARTQKEVLQAGFCSKSMHKDALRWNSLLVSATETRPVSPLKTFFFFFARMQLIYSSSTIKHTVDHCMFDTWNKNNWIVDILYSYIKNKLAISDIESPSNKNGKRDL